MTVVFFERCPSARNLFGQCFISESSLAMLASSTQADSQNQPQSWFVAIKDEKARAGNKPGSVVDNHSSGATVTDRL